jgi:hypothetical protein
VKRLIKFSRRPYEHKMRERRRVEENRKRYEQERIARRRWIVENSFNKEPLLEEWSKGKAVHEKVLTELALSSLSILDAANSTNEVLERGLGLKETVLDVDSIEDLTYNIYVIKMAEVLCSAKCANLSGETTKAVISSIVAQMLPPTMPQKRLATNSDAKGDLLNELLAIKSRG